MSRTARLEQRADDLVHRVDRIEDTQASFAGETGARIKAETELGGELKGLHQRLDEFERRWDKMEDRIREARRFKTTTYIAVGGLVCTAMVIVIGVIGLLH